VFGLLLPRVYESKDAVECPDAGLDLLVDVDELGFFALFAMKPGGA
jgi:hypothetical protein